MGSVLTHRRKLHTVDSVKPAAMLRESVVDQLHSLLSASILEGRLQPESRLNEVHMAAELGVSRTPLREALSRLSQTGLVVSKPNRGFFVAPVSSSEARDLYELLALLEGVALELAWPVDAKRLRTLERVNKALGEASSPVEVIDRNTEWHRTLIEPCQNRILLNLIEGVRTKLLRYEFSFFAPGRQRILESMRRHRDVVHAVARQDLPGARRALLAHWKTDLDGIMLEGNPSPRQRR